MGEAQWLWEFSNKLPRFDGNFTCVTHIDRNPKRVSLEHCLIIGEPLDVLENLRQHAAWGWNRNAWPKLEFNFFIGVAKLVKHGVSMRQVPSTKIQWTLIDFIDHCTLNMDYGLIKDSVPWSQTDRSRNCNVKFVTVIKQLTFPN